MLKYENLKKDYEKKIVFVREGKFYYTFKDDAIIMWYLFDYKWNKEMIVFGDSASSRVFDVLKSKGIGYVVDQNEFIKVNGDDRVYDLQLELSKISYDKYIKKNELFLLIDSLMRDNYSNYDEIVNCLEKFNRKDGMTYEEKEYQSDEK